MFNDDMPQECREEKAEKPCQCIQCDFMQDQASDIERIADSLEELENLMSEAVKALCIIANRI